MREECNLRLRMCYIHYRCGPTLLYLYTLFFRLCYIICVKDKVLRKCVDVQKECKNCKIDNNYSNYLQKQKYLLNKTYKVFKESIKKYSSVVGSVLLFNYS